MDDVDCVRRVFAARCQQAGRKVALVANYDGFHIDEAISSSYFAMVEDLHAQYYEHRDALHHQRLHAHEARRLAVLTQGILAPVRDAVGSGRVPAPERAKP